MNFFQDVNLVMTLWITSFFPIEALDLPPHLKEPYPLGKVEL